MCHRLTACIAAILLCPSGSYAQTRALDVVIRNGRVIDPESGLDAVRSVGISNGKIAAVSTGTLNGRVMIDARGMVVAPGFIDLHAHGQNEENYRIYAVDGVTTALELEVGVGDIPAFYVLAQVNTAPLDFHLTFHFSESLAMAGEIEPALAALAEAVDKGFYAYPFMTQYCPFMAPLRARPEYQRIVERAGRRAGEFRLALAKLKQ